MVGRADDISASRKALLAPYTLGDLEPQELHRDGSAAGQVLRGGKEVTSGNISRARDAKLIHEAGISLDRALFPLLMGIQRPASRV